MFAFTSEDASAPMVSPRFGFDQQRKTSCRWPEGDTLGLNGDSRRARCGFTRLATWPVSEAHPFSQQNAAADD